MPSIDRLHNDRAERERVGMVPPALQELKNAIQNRERSPETLERAGHSGVREEAKPTRSQETVPNIIGSSLERANGASMVPEDT